MTEADLSIVSSKLENEKNYLDFVSKEIWKEPELQFKEVKAHHILTTALEKYGFDVRRHYLLETAFRAEFSRKGDDPCSTVIAFLCEYDALPEIGHACGHNLIAEAGLAAAVAAKAVMESDSSVEGKIVVIGCPAEEGGGGKIRLLEQGAFKDITAALMVHPARVNSTFAQNLCIVKAHVTFKGKAAHASAYPWEGCNALDAAVACYVSIGLLRQQIKPMCRIHGIITKGGAAPNIIPDESKMEFYIRAPTVPEVKSLCSRVKACFESAATSSACQVEYDFQDKDIYMNVLTNRVLGTLYKDFVESMGMKCQDNVGLQQSAGSTDMGNVSHVVPSIHPFFAIGGHYANHTSGFTETAGSPSAQPPTMIAAKAMALTALKVMRSAELREQMKIDFEEDLEIEANESI